MKLRLANKVLKYRGRYRSGKVIKALSRVWWAMMRWTTRLRRQA